MVGRASRSIFALYLASAVFVTVQRGVFSPSNNFKVFRAAAVNLLAHRDLYAAHPDQHFDFYKYSPTFALLFAPLAVLGGGTVQGLRPLRKTLPAGCGRAGLLPAPPLALCAVRRGRGAGPRAAAAARDSAPRADRPVPLVVGHRIVRRQSREPRRLGDAIPPPVARNGLAELARAARRHAAASGSARPRAGALEQPGLPPPLPLLAAH